MKDQPGFDRLAPQIRRVLHELEWESLRPIQIRAIDALHDTTDDLIVSARTASGKTEAAFLPILSQLVDEPKGSVRALYVSPLRALINDQFRRLEILCKRSDIPVHRRHKDVGQADRDRLFRDPGGVLAITPESIEALLLNRSALMSSLFRGLRYVVVDELHAFVGRERGVQLRSLLNRLFRYVESRPRIVALSATLGDSYDIYRRWIRPDRPESVAIVEDAPSQREVDLAIKAFEITPEDEEENSKKRRTYEFSGDLVDDVMAMFAGEKNLFFANRKDALESLADVLNEHCELDRRPPEFLAHHGSLSKEARERAEQRMHGEKPTTLLCTSTLELGIDVGRVKVVGQMGPAWSVASLVQRLGRSGRRTGDRPGIQLYLQHYEGADSTNLIAPLVPDLLQAIAMMELLRERWMESPSAGELDLSTFVHQILAIIKEAGGILPADLYPRLLGSGMFDAVDEETFIAVLRSLKQKDAIDQVSTGELILGIVGEKLAAHYEFYSVFLTPLEYEVKHERESIGTIPAVAVPLVKDHLILANRRWRVEAVDAERLTIKVAPARARKPPKFLGAGGEIDSRIRREMRTVLLADRSYDYLNATAREWLANARREAIEYGLRSREIVSLGDERQCWFTWTGTRAQRTLIAAARKAGIEAADEKVAIVLKCSLKRLHEFATDFVQRAPTTEQLAAELPYKQMRKFDRFLSDDLLMLCLARNCFEIDEARRVASLVR